MAAPTASAQTPTPFATGVTSPGGGMVLAGTAINSKTGAPYRHLWTSDQGGFGLCRIDPDVDTPGPHFLNGGFCMPFVDGVQSSLVNSLSILYSTIFMRWTCKPTPEGSSDCITSPREAAAMAPWILFIVGFKQSGDILRITAPQTDIVPCANVQVIGSTPDNTRDMGLGWIGHDLYGGDGRAAFIISNAISA